MLFFIYAAVTFLIGLSALMTFMWYRRRLRLFELTAETEGIITKITKGSFAISPEPKGPVYSIRVEYTVDGRDYKTSMQCENGDKEFTEGQAVTVLYDPEKPSRAIPKDFNREHALYYWRMLVILALILFAAAILVTGLTLPQTLGLSKEKKQKFNFGRDIFLSVTMPVGYLIIRHTESCKKEKERDPKSTKTNFLFFIGIWGECVISLIFDVISIII